MAQIIIRPNAAGDQTNLSRIPDTGEANWQDVDEEIADESATLVYTPLGGGQKIDLYNLSNPIQTGTITKVTEYIRCMGNLGLGSHAWTIIRLGLLSAVGPPIALTPAFTNYYNDFTRPGDDPWTWNYINSLQAGVRLEPDSDNKVVPWCTQIWVVVTYTPIAPPHRKSSFLKMF